MLKSGLRILIGTLVFISITCYPLPLLTPARNISADLWLRLQPVFVQQPVATNIAELTSSPRPAGSPSRVSQLKKESVTATATMPPPAATAKIGENLASEALPALPSQEEIPQITTEQEKEAFEAFVAKIPSVFYRLGVPDKVALTFDDGPCPGMTEKYLEVLHKHGVQSTFFVVGRQAVLYPETTKYITAQGSEIGSHSWRHAALDRLKPEQITADLEKTAAQIYSLLEYEILYFRPPYGRKSANVLAAAKELGQKLVFWDVDPRDWENPAPEEIVKRVMEQVKPGSIILLHEGRQNTLAALPGIVKALQARGLQPVSITGLLSAANQEN